MAKAAAPSTRTASTVPSGAQASATLITAVRSLLDEAGLELGQLDALVFGRGPGSFTGLRTACAVAQGLAWGANAGRGIPVLPIDTLAAVAEQARFAHGCSNVVAVLDARMDEVYMAHYQWQSGTWQNSGAPALSAPEDVQVPPGWTVAGNAQAAYGERLRIFIAHAGPAREGAFTQTIVLSEAAPLRRNSLGDMPYQRAKARENAV